MTLTALDDVLRHAASVRVSEIEWYGEVVVDLTLPGELGRLRAVMAVESLTGAVCACRGQVLFEFLDAEGERLTSVVLHGESAIDWHGFDGYARTADGLLLRWLGEHGLPNPLFHAGDRPEWLAWKAAIPPALHGLTADLMCHFPMPADSSHVIEARRRIRGLDRGVLELLEWSGSGMRSGTGSPPYEDVPGLILQDVPIAEIVAALQDPHACERHDAGAAKILLVGKSRIKQRMDVARLPGPIRIRIREAAKARGYAVPDWAERLLLNA